MIVDNRYAFCRNIFGVYEDLQLSLSHHRSEPVTEVFQVDVLSRELGRRFSEPGQSRYRPQSTGQYPGDAGQEGALMGRSEEDDADDILSQSPEVFSRSGITARTQ